MKSRPLYILGLVALIVLGIQIVFAQTRMGGSTSGALAGPPTPVVSPATPYGPATMVMPDGRTAQIPAFKSDSETASSIQITGRPAIPPRQVGTGPTTPAFTAADVKQYHQVHAGLDSCPSSRPVTIVTIQFVTEKELRSQLASASTGLPDDALLCLVVYNGEFLLQGPPGSNASVTYPRAAEVFDAHTGNLLMTRCGVQ